MGRFLTGSESERLYFSASSESIYQYQLWRPTRCEARAQGKIAPSSKVRFLLGMTKAGSTSSVCPSPVQRGQAPCGELKEKSRGSIGGRERWQTGQAKCSEKRWSSKFPPLFSMATMAIPSPFRSAVSKESTTRGRSVSLSRINLSTKTSKECFFLGSREISSASSIRMGAPSILTRKNPSFCKNKSSRLCSPFRSRTTGPKIKIEEPLGNSKIFFTIRSTDCRSTLLPHSGQ